MAFPILRQINTRLATVEAANLITRVTAIEGEDFDTRHGVLAADYTLTSTTAAQKAFNWSAAGALTLPTGVYSFQAVLYLDTMSATSGNAAFGLLGAGTATMAKVLYQHTGKDSATATNANTMSGAISVTPLSVASMVSGAVNTTLDAMLNGVFEITAAGTIIPSLSLVTAAAAVVKAGSYFRCTRLGATGSATSGIWS